MPLDQFSDAQLPAMVTPSLSVGELSRLEVSQLVSGTADGVVDEVGDICAHPGLAFGSAVLGVGLSVAFSALAVRSPKAGAALGSAAKIFFGIDMGNRVVETIAAGVDTAFSPEDYEKNRATVAKYLGRGLIDYVGFAAASLGGFEAGEALLLRNDKAALSRAFKNNSIPKLKRVLSNRAVPGDESVDSAAGKIFLSQKNNIVKVSNETGTGSGFFVDSEQGLIATNYHVITGAKKHTFRMDDGTSYFATLVARDKFADLAVLRPITDTHRVWPEVELGSTADLTTGSTLLSIGHPAGLEREVLSTGNLKQMITAFNDKPVEYIPPLSVLDARLPVLPGSSGSPIFSKENKVVGIVSRSSGNDTEGTGVQHLKEILRHIKEHGEFDGWLEVRSRVKPVGNVGTTGSNLPELNIESVSKVRNRLRLAESVVPKYVAAETRKSPATGLDSLSRSEFRRIVGAASISVTANDLFTDIRDSQRLF